MERQKDKFGVNSLDDIQEQMKLYAQKWCEFVYGLYSYTLLLFMYVWQPGGHNVYLSEVFEKFTPGQPAYLDHYPENTCMYIFCFTSRLCSYYYHIYSIKCPPFR